MVERQHNRAPRYALSSVRAEIDGDAVMIVDVSPTGLLISGASASLERGDAVTVRLSVPLMQKVVPLGVDGFVVRSDDRGIAIDYVKPSITWPHVLGVLNAKEQS